MLKNWDWEEWSNAYDDLGRHGWHLDDWEKLRMAFMLSGIHMHDDLFLEMRQLSRQAESFFKKVRTQKIQIDSYIWEVEQMMAYLLTHQELCKWSRWYEWYPLLNNLRSKLDTKKILTLWRSAEYVAFCQRQEYYQWLHTLVDRDNVCDRKGNSQETLHVLVGAMHEEHIQKTESLYGWDGWTLYPEEKEDQ